MKENKGVFYTIIILLIVFLPLTIFGYINNKKIENNSEKKLYHNGYLWFYDNEELLGKYECSTKSCSLAKSTIPDKEYKIKYYTEGTNEDIDIINNKYVFINDGTEIIFYDIHTDSVLTKYKSINTYNSNLNNNEYILENIDGLWGVLSFTNDIASIIPFEYDFIGLSKDLNDSDFINTDYYLVKKDNEWYVIDKENNIVTNKYYNIYEYKILDNFIGVVSDNKLDIYDLDGNITNSFDIDTNYKTLDILVENNNIKVIIDDEEKYNIEITNNF